MTAEDTTHLGGVVGGKFCVGGGVCVYSGMGVMRCISGYIILARLE